MYIIVFYFKVVEVFFISGTGCTKGFRQRVSRIESTNKRRSPSHWLPNAYNIPISNPLNTPVASSLKGCKELTHQKKE